MVAENTRDKKSHAWIFRTATGFTIRSFYYTAVKANDPQLDALTWRIRECGFNPSVFKKQKEKSKGVDITLAKDVLMNAFFGNYDVAVLVAGDADYVPLIEEVKRLGKVVYLIFFENEGLSKELHMASDHFFEMTGSFLETWR